MYLFPDTHFFLHFKHAHEIPWSDMTADAEIHLIVGRAVAKELEKKKYEMRGRAQERTRHYISKLGDIAVRGAPGLLREKGPKVLLHIQQPRPPGWTPPVDLDPTWGDDVLIADALAFKHGQPAADARVLTGDPGLMSKALVHGLGVVGLNGRGWDLQEEKTSEQKELERLRRENEEMKRAGPAIEFALEVGERPEERIEAAITRYAPLTDQEVGDLLAELKTRHPKATEFPGPSPHAAPGSHLIDMDSESESVEWRAPTQDEVDAYEKRYDGWMSETESLLRGLHERVQAPPLFADFTILISNSGNNSADGARLWIESFGDFGISKLDDGEDASERSRPEQAPLPKLGRPPSPPTWKKVPKPSAAAATVKLPPSAWETLARVRGDLPASSVAALAAIRGDMPHINYLSAAAEASVHHERFLSAIGSPVLPKHYRHPLGILDPSSQNWPVVRPPPVAGPASFVPRPIPPRDRHVFYKVSRPKLSPDATSGVVYECEKFPHRNGPVAFTIRASAEQDEPETTDGAIRITMWAENLRNPATKTFPIRLYVDRSDLRGLAAGLLP